MFNDPIINIPGYSDLAKKIIAIQKEFINKFKVEYKSIYLPQLILVTFKQIQAFEEKIINRLRIVGMGFHPIKIELKDFGSFSSHTIFINVSTKHK